MQIAAWVVLGLVVGVFARAAAPGRRPVGFVGTALLGIGGSVVGGLVADARYGGGPGGLTTAGFFGSLVGAIVLLAISTGAAAVRRRAV